jgi:hypothetical protein
VESISPAEAVTETLESYARKGVFRGFSRAPTRGARTIFRLAWHYDRVFDLELDLNRHTLRFPALLTEVPAGKVLYPALLSFVRARQSQELPEHRRIDVRRAQVKCYRRSGRVSLTVEVKDGDYQYAARKLIHLVQEIFLDFLREGPGYEYLVEAYGLDPDRL